MTAILALGPVPAHPAPNPSTGLLDLAAASAAEKPAVLVLLALAVVLFTGGLTANLLRRRTRTPHPAGHRPDATADEHTDEAAADEAAGEAVGTGRDEQLDLAHTTLTGVAADDADLGRHPVHRTVHLRTRHTARPDTGDDAPVARATTRTPHPPADATPRVPDVAPGAGRPLAPVPAAADDDRDPYALLAAAAGDSDRLTAFAEAHPQLAHTAHLYAATLDTPHRYRHLRAAAAAASTDADDHPRARALLAGRRIPVPLPAHHALAHTDADRTGVTLALAAADLDAGQTADAATAAGLTHLLQPTPLSAHLAHATDTPDTDPTTSTAGDTSDDFAGTSAGGDGWALLAAHRRLLAAEAAGADRAAVDRHAAAVDATLTATPDTGTGGTGTCGDDDVQVDRAALAADVATRRARAAHAAGDTAAARALLGTALDHHPAHRPAQDLLRRLDR